MAGTPKSLPEVVRTTVATDAVQGPGQLGGALRAGDQPAPQHVARRGSRDPAGRHVHGVLRNRTGRLPLPAPNGMVSPTGPSRRPVPGQRGTSRLYRYRHDPAPPRQALGGVARAARVAPDQQCSPRPRALEPDPTRWRIAVPPVHGVVNIDYWYSPMDFTFTTAHFWTAWLVVGALVIHIGAKAATVRRRTRFRPDPSAWDEKAGRGPPRHRSPWRRPRKLPRAGLGRRGFLARSWARGAARSSRRGRDDCAPTAARGARPAQPCGRAPKRAGQPDRSPGRRCRDGRRYGVQADG